MQSIVASLYEQIDQTTELAATSLAVIEGEQLTAKRLLPLPAFRGILAHIRERLHRSDLRRFLEESGKHTQEALIGFAKQNHVPRAFLRGAGTPSLDIDTGDQALNIAIQDLIDRQVHEVM